MGRKMVAVNGCRLPKSKWLASGFCLHNLLSEKDTLPSLDHPGKNHERETGG